MRGIESQDERKDGARKVPARPEELFFNASRRVRVGAELDSTKETICNLLPTVSTQFKA